MGCHIFFQIFVFQGLFNILWSWNKGPRSQLIDSEHQSDSFVLFALAYEIYTYYCQLYPNTSQGFKYMKRRNNEIGGAL